MHKSKNGYVKKSRNKVLLKHKFFNLSVKVKYPESLQGKEMLDFYFKNYVEILNETQKK